MPIESISLSPEASRTNGRSYNVSRCILFSRVWEAEVKRLQKEVKLLNKDKEVMWAMIEEAKE